ncbi:hypothetical protein HC022_11880 [Salipiger sp. HF18]|nr:hypothetical protein [Salipiger sp. HF18]NIY96911.1 hypothetical protein [Salipiger sp. HF18]
MTLSRPAWVWISANAPMAHSIPDRVAMSAETRSSSMCRMRMSGAEERSR